MTAPAASVLPSPESVSIASWTIGADTLSTVPYPVALQRRAQQAERNYALRAAVRRTALIVADVCALLLLRALLGAVREFGVLGEKLSHSAHILLPKGTFFPHEVLGALLIGLTMTGAYSGGLKRAHFRPLLFGVLIGLSLIFWGRFWMPFSVDHLGWQHLAKSLFTLSFGVVVLSGTLLLERRIVGKLVSLLRPLKQGTLRVLAVGDTAACMGAIAQFVDGESAFTGVGAFATREGFDPAHGRDRAALIEAITERHADTVLLCGDLAARLADEVIRVADRAGCRVLATSRLQRSPALTPSFIFVNGQSLTQLTRPGLRTGQLVSKRVFDVAAAAAGLVAISPVLALIALAVKLTSRGPVFFRQSRVGRASAPFLICKFRTMIPHAEALRSGLAAANMYGDGRLFKMRNDPRVTPLGRVLRATSMDELPQLWNVLCGDMSLVGPRPPMESELKLYREHDYARFDMPPGITGPWQVSGRNNVTDFDEVVRLESAYMRGWSFGKDVEILLKTVPVVLGRAGAL